MRFYLLLKAIHVAGAAVLFGTGLGIAFFKWSTDRTANAAAIRVVSEQVVLADWMFTLPAIVLQALSGITLAEWAGYPLLRGWLGCSLALFCVAGCCWIPVVWLQLRMRALARAAEREHTPLGPAYRSYARLWFWLGMPAFAALLLVFWLMVAKPQLP